MRIGEPFGARDYVVALPESELHCGYSSVFCVPSHLDLCDQGILLLTYK